MRFALISLMAMPLFFGCGDAGKDDPEPGVEADADGVGDESGGDESSGDTDDTDDTDDTEDTDDTDTSVEDDTSSEDTASDSDDVEDDVDTADVDTDSDDDGGLSCDDGEVLNCSETFCVDADWVGDGDCESYLDCEVHDFDGGDCATDVEAGEDTDVEDVEDTDVEDVEDTDVEDVEDTDVEDVEDTDVEDTDGAVTASCPGEFAGPGPGCCEDPDESTTLVMSPSVCVDGEWTCETAGESICSCAGSTAMYDCVTSCDEDAEVGFPFCVYGDHFECPYDMIRSDSCTEPEDTGSIAPAPDEEDEEASDEPDIDGTDTAIDEEVDGEAADTGTDAEADGAPDSEPDTDDDAEPLAEDTSSADDTAMAVGPDADEETETVDTAVIEELAGDTGLEDHDSGSDDDTAVAEDSGADAFVADDDTAIEPIPASDACGWPRNDPGSLVSTGSDVGDVVDNVELTDQCGETVSLWDFYDEYTLVLFTAVWEPGIVDYGSLEEIQADFTEREGLPMRFGIYLWEDADFAPATTETVVDFVDAHSLSEIPVFADPDATILFAALPGFSIATTMYLPQLCMIAPDRTLLGCELGVHPDHPFEYQLDLAREHALPDVVPEESRLDCTVDEIPDCEDVMCVSSGWLTDGVCDPELDCAAAGYDGGDCLGGF